MRAKPITPEEARKSKNDPDNVPDKVFDALNALIEINIPSSVSVDRFSVMEEELIEELRRLGYSGTVKFADWMPAIQKYYEERYVIARDAAAGYGEPYYPPVITFQVLPLPT